MDNINDNLTEEQEVAIDNQDVTQEPGVIDVDVLEQQPVDLPEPAEGTGAATTSADIGQAMGEQAQVDRDEIEVARQESAKLEAQQKSEEDQVRLLSGESRGQADAEAKAIEDSSIGEAQKAIDNLDKAILASSKALSQQKINDDLAVGQLAGQGRGIPASIVRGRQALLGQQLKAKRDSAALELNNDIATSKLLQGKTDEARKAIERNIELKFADKKLELEQEIGYLERTDSKLADAKKKELAAVKKQEEEEESIFDVAEQARAAGAGQAEINAILNSENKAEAIREAKSLGRMAKLDAAYKNAQIAKIGFDMEESRKETQAKIDEGKLTPEQLEAQKSSAKAKIDSINNLLNNKIGLESAVGPTAINRGIFAGIEAQFGPKDEFIGTASQLISGQVLQELIDIKAEGATFGNLSDGERLEVGNSATKLNAWAVRDALGNIKYFDVDQNSLKTELNLIKKNMNKVYVGAGGVPTMEVDEDGLIDDGSDEPVNVFIK